MSPENKKARRAGLIIIRTMAKVCLIVDVVGFVATKDSLFILAGIFSGLGIIWSAYRETNS